MKRTNTAQSNTSNKVQRLASPSVPPVKIMNDITECSICTKVICNPKILPCVHTFCLECLEKLDKQPEDKVPCPYCNTIFTVPDGGFSGLPTNSFVEKLLEAQRLSTEYQNRETACDICMCLKIENGLDDVQPAEMYCVECQENMCGRCSLIHTKMKMSKSHQMLPMESLSLPEQLLQSFKNHCDLHPNKEIDIYCQACKQAVCSACFVANHNKHNCSDIMEVVEKLKNQLEKDIEQVDKLITAGGEKSEILWKQVEDFTESVAQAEEAISQRGEEIKCIVDKHVQSLLEQLQLQKSKKLTELEDIKEMLEFQHIVLESFRKYSQEVFDKAAPIDLVRIVNELNQRTNQLKHQPSLGTGKRVSFSPSDLQTFEANAEDNIIGRISLSNSATSEVLVKGVSLLTMIPFNSSVSGVSIHGKEIFTILRGSNEISVYNSDTLAHQRSISVTGLSNPWDIAAGKGVLYISERNNKFIYKVQLPEIKIMKWSSDSHLLGLSVMKNNNILVTCFDKNKLIEYSPFGMVVREIVFQQEMNYPRHAIQVEDDHFLVCHVSSLHRVCLVDSGGTLISSYGGIHGAQLGHLNTPCHLAAFANGFILVADPFNNRVILLNTALELVGEYISESLGMTKPCRLCLDEEQKKLYLAVDNNKSVAVFNIP